MPVLVHETILLLLGRSGVKDKAEKGLIGKLSAAAREVALQALQTGQQRHPKSTVGNCSLCLAFFSNFHTLNNVQHLLSETLFSKNFQDYVSTGIISVDISVLKSLILH